MRKFTFINQLRKNVKRVMNFRDFKYFSSSDKGGVIKSENIKSGIFNFSHLNNYQGIELNLEKLIPLEQQQSYSKLENESYLQEFSKAIEDSLIEWDSKSIRSLTITVPAYLSHLIP